jgi:hypothetical protein
VAVRRYQAIEGLRTRDAGVPAVLEQARAARVHFTTLYRWFRHYQTEDGRIAALAPNGSQGGRGQSRLDPRCKGSSRRCSRIPTSPSRGSRSAPSGA